MINNIKEYVSHSSYIAIDVEGDGNKPQMPVEISLIEFEAGILMNRHHWMVNPGGTIEPFVTHNIHGITNGMVANSPQLHEIADDIRDIVDKKVLVGHGISQDLMMLRLGIPEIDFLPTAIFDTAKLSKIAFKEKHPLSLVRSIDRAQIDMSKFQGVRSNCIHSADIDAYAAGCLLIKLTELLPDDPKFLSQVSNSITVRMSAQQREKRLRIIEKYNSENRAYIKP